MANEKKRGFFSWLGFGQKEQAEEAQTESQQVTEQPVEETPATEPAADSEKFAEEVVEVSEQLAHEEAQPEPVVEEQALQVEHEELPLPEEVAEQEIGAEEWQTEAEPLVEEDAPLSDEELDAQALAAEAAEEAVMVVPPEDAAQEQEKPTKEGFFARLKRSLLKTKENLGSGFISLFRGKKIDDDLFEELEEQLLIADVGVETTRRIITNLTEGASRKQLRDAEALYGLLKEEMSDILAKVDEPLNIEGKTPFVILMVGVNGVGKTTTIGKLARQFEQQGKSVMLAAGDTFRAAAVEQLQVWGQRNNIPVIAQHTGADSASVIFDAIQAAKARNIDVLIADTAGRLQNKSHLMEELKKIVRVMKKLDEDAPHEVMLTIDASTGQNAISQAKLFHEAVGLTGITLTKLDGTAKGGVIFSVADQFGIPIRYIGVGERIEDLRPFNAGDFIEALFARED
ncbi:signal recognition particle-docking protein FtsY [Kosakonia radicincitans DSM 16656]|uniref:Signal recognition particle receptor FtsY n=1 Tax=Kosakonia radicincitans TaxID=283686 RepID=A0AAX2EUS3_9ENTR|nr:MULTISPECIES: signal recognition particle-docking protein FtsY [Kosakonia]MDP9567814.1 fused signal recognition particle receptor [Kosakonia oryzae]APG20339.1 signal recognition particle-docking protein FtsY [Kosakonia radicincitans]ARD58636.1 signal recognition particle-docking protein FtsY [Kosakonia radicincitans DSM 16656]KDE34561.1 cell division protein FtsY [Kosakonia radicincitans UMEnt01/12]MDD7994301.1 signal recognition particle-docking protein FtsY [Kosakonia radicincitans]